MIFTASLLALAPLVAQDAAPQRPPNVLVMIADDQGYGDLSLMGLNPDAATPSIDRLAGRGTFFTTAYASSPICNASRAAILTGCYQQRFGTYWYGGRGLHDERFTTLAEVLRDAGFATGYVGKFHYGSNHKPEHRNFPLNHGFEQFFGFSGGRKHYLIHEAAVEREFMQSKRRHERKGQSLQMGAMWEGDQPVDQQGLSTELFGERARDFMTAHREEPFFLVVGFNAVHNFTHQLPQEYLKEHELTGYRDWDPAVEDYYDWYREGRKPNNPEGRAHYIGQLHYLDREVGRVLDHLDDLGLAEETVVVYVGDNGGSTPIYADNGPLRGSKYTLYEGGIRVPLIISWPGRWKGGERLDNVVSSMDLYPTLLRATGCEPPVHIDGVDLTGLLDGDQPDTHHEVLVWDTGHETAVRMGRWKLKTADDMRHADYEMVELELGTFLYDLENDPGETRDLAQERPEILAKLDAVYEAWRERVRR